MNVPKLKLTGIITLFLIVFNYSSFAQAEITLKLINGKKFSDYEIADQSRSKSLQTLEKSLNKLFSDISLNYLKEDQKMEVDVTNVDLPGTIRHSFGPQHRDTRVVTENSPFKLYFNYRIKNNENKIIKEGEYKIREFSDLGLITRKRRFRGNVSYYEQPLNKWFETLFIENTK